MKRQHKGAFDAYYTMANILSIALSQWWSDVNVPSAGMRGLAKFGE